jgi:hypothetical protein
MKTSWAYLAVLLWFIPACSSRVPSDLTAPGSGGGLEVREVSGGAGCVCWGTCDLVIARDGSEWEIIPSRGADGTWGYHLNAVKLLEVSPGKDCIKIAKVNVLPNGDLAVDVSITHPYDDPIYTGFDVRGIIMLPSSQFLPDNELRAHGGLEPLGQVHTWFASYRKGDAELINPDGYTLIWSPYEISDQKHMCELEEGYPIFGYYDGRMASGDHVGTHNGFKRYYTNENRHMFEVGRTATRSFVIRPPAEGPIEASYAVYAHWAPPSVYPVTNPAVDFPPEANSPLPYEFWIEQIGPIDPDAPRAVQAIDILWHIKYWHFGIENWAYGWCDLLGNGAAGGDISLTQAFDQCPDCYRLTGFFTSYAGIPDILPGAWPVKFTLNIDNDGKALPPHLATEYYIAWLDIDAADGEW